MTDNERIARAMGWRRSRPGITGRRGIIWVRGRWEQQKNEPDYFANPALLGEMLDWLRQRHDVGINVDKLHGPWSVCLFEDGCYITLEVEDPVLQKAVARCVLWALGQE